jgi:hypothetical protein
VTVDTYSVLPTGDGDGDQLMQNIGSASQSVNETTGFVGSQLVGFFQHPTVCFFRFEITMPKGATINGIEFNAKTAASGTLGPIEMTAGFCKRQGTANPWEASNGLAAWSNQAHIPFGEANTFTGVQTYPAVWWGDAPAFADEELDVVSGIGGTWTIGEGTLTGGTAADVTGMIAQLQSYLDDATVSASRGATVNGAISILFQIYRDYTGTANQSQPLRFSDHTNSASHPVLKIDWTAGPSGASARPFLGPSVSARASIQTTVSARASVGPRISARPVIV